MEVRPGYKQTEVGLIPEEWEVTRIADVSDVKTGPYGSALHMRDYVDDGTPIITVEHLGELGVMHVNLPLVSDADRKRLRAYLLDSGDIVFSRVGSVDRNALIRKSEAGWLFSGRLLRVRAYKSKAFAPYLSYQFHSEPFKRRVHDVAVGQTMASINTQILNSITTILPILHEQRAIAAALGDVDALLRALTRLIVKKRDLKQGAMQQLLAGQTRLPGFSGEWDIRRFGNIAMPRKDRIDPRKSAVQEFCVELENIEATTGRLIGSTKTSEDSSLKSVFREGDVLFGKLRAYLRKYWLADRPGVCSTEIWVLVPNAILVTDAYLFQLIKSDQFIEAASSTYGTHMPRSDWNVIKNYELPLPSLREQAAIAAMLSDMDAEIAAHEARQAKTRALKQGMMQELLTGKTRLI